MNEIMQALINEVPQIIDKLHFIRADWFYAFIPLFLFLLLMHKKTTSNKNWNGIVDPQLAPFVLTKNTGKQRRYPLPLIFISASLCITALAGPVYKKLAQPVYSEQSALIVLLDLSQSMNATDIKPSRLSRAKLELLDLLETRDNGQTALIVFAAQAFAVTPLTDDNTTIANLVPALETEMMPAQGSNLSAALAKAFSLLTQAGVLKGDILVITDDIRQSEEHAIEKVTSQGHRLSIFGIGTKQGAPIPLPQASGGGFLQDSNGAIIVPKLQSAKLQGYALRGGGLYVSLQADDSDTNTLVALFQSSKISQGKTKESSADIWQEEGHWLLLPLLFFAALWARKGWLAILLIFVLPLPPQAHAESSEPGWLTGAIADKKYLWLSPDQKAMKAFNADDHENAARHFVHPEWKASAYYRKGDYETAIKAYDQALKNNTSSNSYYNKGNALAKLEKYEDAIKAYDKALEIDKNHNDANYNREQVKASLKKQQQEAAKQDSSESGESQQQSSDKNQQQKKDNKINKNNPQSSDNSDSSEQDASQEQAGEQSQNKAQSAADVKQKQQAENEQLKQRDAETEEKKQQEELKKYQQNQKNQNNDQKQQQNKAETIENKKPENNNATDKPLEIEVNPLEASISEDASITEEERATEQWLKRIPDDPGGLLRRKFYYQYQNNPNQNDSNEPW